MCRNQSKTRGNVWVNIVKIEKRSMEQQKGCKAEEEWTRRDRIQMNIYISLIHLKTLSKQKEDQQTKRRGTENRGGMEEEVPGSEEKQIVFHIWMIMSK